MEPYRKKWTDSRAAGGVPVSRTALESKLGRSTTLVWHVLLSLRDANGFVWCGQEYLAGRTLLSRATVTRALRRLTACKLVTPLGWSPAPRPCPGRGVAPVYGRRAWGRLAGAHVRVPRATAVALGLVRVKRKRSGPRSAVGPATRPPRSGAGLAGAVRGAQRRVRRAVAAAAGPRGAGPRVDAASPAAVGANAGLARDPAGTSGQALAVRRPCAVVDDYGAIVHALGPCPGPRTRWVIAFRQTQAELGIDRLADLPRLFAPSNFVWKPRSTVQVTSSSSFSGAWSRLEDDDEPAPDGPKQRDRTARDGTLGHAPARDGTDWSDRVSLPATDATDATTGQTEMSLLVRPDEPQVLHVQEQGNPSPSERDGAADGAASPAGAEVLFSRSGLPAHRGLLTVDGLVPPYPTTDLIPAVKLPPMPRISDAAGDVEKVTALVAAYRAAAVKKYGPETKARWIYARGIHPKVKNFRALVNCAELCLEHEISPHGWALFSIDNWIDKNGSGKPPPVTFVFNRSRLQRQHGWYRSQSAEYSDARVVLGPLHHLLLVRWTRMQGELVRNQPGTVQAVRAIVERFFPGKTWDEMVDRARRESRERTALLKDAVASGQWIWD